MDAQQRARQTSTSPTRPLHELVTEQAARSPNAIAVVDGPARITYRELDRWANRLAYFLRSQGVRQETLVGVCLPRCADLLVALLGVWKAGGAYLPLDPTHPAERLHWMVENTGVRLIITDVASAPVVAGTGARPVQIDAVTGGEALPFGAPDAKVGLDNAAYVIYTSGSTGRPKGVIIDHGGIANRVVWTVNRHGISQLDRVLQKTSLSFDAAGWELFAPLVGGGTVVMAEAGAERDPAAMVRAVIDQEITVLQGVPSVLRLVADDPAWPDCRTLRLVFSAGEPLHGELAAKLAESGAQVWNTYGPTECSIDVTAQPVDPAVHTGPVPIGRPIDHMRALVLDPDGEPVPPGVAGELFGAGVGLARGYVGRPDLTAERFVPDPYGPPGSRLYRTGDLVRWRADGTLDYLGRADDQIKVNGVRIEPGEVETALVAHPGVRGAAVTAVPGPDGNYRLAAYLLTAASGGNGSSAAAPTADEMRNFLRERLPEPLIPSVYVNLDSFPLTTSGKVDRSALPEPDLTSSTGRPPYVAPRTPAEQLVARVWGELLGVDRVGVHDNFFTLGGASLVLTRLASQLRAASGGAVDMRGLFEANTVEEQARLVRLDTPSDATMVLPTLPMRRLRADQPAPLSFGQHRLWFLDQVRPGGPEWVAPVFLRIPAAVRVSTVQWALNELEARHDSLRTRYVVVDGEPMQVAAPPSTVELRVADAPVDELVRLFGEQFTRGFDLTNGPLWRALLVRVPGEDHVLLMTAHHIATDGWSAVIMEREIAELCAARHADRPADLPRLPLRYADYASWQRTQLTDQVVERELTYWRTTLAGLEALNLPTDAPRAPERDPSGSGVEVRISAELAGKVAELGRRYGATPFMTMLTAYAMVISRHSGQVDFALGTPIAGRTRPEVENVVGLFLNPLVLRCNLSGDPTFAAALERTREMCLSAFAHSDLPFERLVDELEPDRDLSRTPLYQVAFDLQDGGLTTSGDADRTAALAFQQAWRVAKTDLTLFVWRRPDGSMTGAIEYASALFRPETVRRLADHLVLVLEAVTADPTARLSTVDMVSPAERQRLLVDWNDPAGRWWMNVPALFEGRVAAAPHALAVECGSHRMTYAQLDRSANRLAHHLIDAGVGSGSVVGVLLDRGPDLVVALLAVWKAGAAYLPLDPANPAERLSYVLDTVNAATVLTQRAHADRVTRPVIEVDTEADQIATRPDHRLAVTNAPDDPAYVIFTSGSTGRPKGVQVSHRNLTNYLVPWVAEQVVAKGSDGAPLFSSVAFDMVVTVIWAPLITGQRLVLLPADLELTQLGRTLVEAGPFAFIKLTPSHLELLSHQIDPVQAARLATTYVVGGEALPPALANQWLQVLGPGRLVNEYGPTETTVANCVYPVVDRLVGETVPIGRPLPGASLYVLDGGLRLTPVGVVGELYIGGAGVGQGYVNQPAMTAERFIPDPYGPPGARLYRTGDRARWLPDGNIDFLGRADDQVKIRGYRIELGEIRATLLTHPGVADAVVVAVDQRLVAYVVQAEPVPAADLTAHCALRLPDYMVPTAFVPLDAVPLNANGKVDRRALPDPDRVLDGATHVGPRTVVEERIAAVWTELLGVTAGIHDRFFQVGGNSILVIRLIARIQAEYDIDLPVQAIFDNPTIAGMAAAVETRIRAEIEALSDTALLQMEGHAS